MVLIGLIIGIGVVLQRNKQKKVRERKQTSKKASKQERKQARKEAAHLMLCFFFSRRRG